MAGSAYSSDPSSLPDTAFAPADLEHLAVGNRGRLLDARRTPLRITAVDIERCEVEVQIEAFEDRGARWRLPAWEISRLQLAKGSAPAQPDLPARLAVAIEQFDQPLAVPVDTSTSAGTWRRVTEHRARLRLIIQRLAPLLPLESYVQRREGDPRLYAGLDDYLAQHGLLEMDRHLTRTLVSNPRSGELVKGHAIVLAELGLCPFTGTVVRSADLFAGEWSRAMRAEHIVIRMAFAQELWPHLFGPTVRLYRAAATDGAMSRTAPSFVSCTFAEPIADAHFVGGPTTTIAVKWRQDVGPERMLMTFLETAAFNTPYREAEALLIGSPANAAF